MARGTEPPCPGCGRVVALRFASQYRANGGRGAGKARVRHHCPHGTLCVFGSRTHGQGFNWPRCRECMPAARARYAAAHRPVGSSR